jgi:hypothetical protein
VVGGLPGLAGDHVVEVGDRHEAERTAQPGGVGPGRGRPPPPRPGRPPARPARRAPGRPRRPARPACAAARCRR